MASTRDQSQPYLQALSSKASSIMKASDESKTEWVSLGGGVYRKTIKSDVIRAESLETMGSVGGSIASFVPGSVPSAYPFDLARLLQVNSIGDEVGSRGSESALGLFPRPPSPGSDSVHDVLRSGAFDNKGALATTSTAIAPSPGSSAPPSPSSSKAVLSSPALSASSTLTPTTSDEGVEAAGHKAFGEEEKVDHVATASDAHYHYWFEEDEYEKEDTDLSYKNLVWNVFDKPLAVSSRQTACAIVDEGQEVTGSVKPVSIFDEYYQGRDFTRSVKSEESFGLYNTEQRFDRAVGSGRPIRGKQMDVGRREIDVDVDAIQQWNADLNTFDPFNASFFATSYLYPHLTSFLTTPGATQALLPFPMDRADVDRLTDELDLLLPIPDLDMSVSA